MAIISVEEARQLSRSTLIKSGMDNKEAEIITDILLEAEMMGRSTHGFIRLPAIVDEAKKHLDSNIKVIREDGNYALVDGGSKPGYVAAYYARAFSEIIERLITSL
jgi:L-2-hydroxycarboxylate dehydrogenase (NAD+)